MNHNPDEYYNRTEVSNSDLTALRDILHQRTGVSQRISASGRSDSWNEQVYSYAMLQFTYRLNVFKGSHARGRKARQRP